MHKLLLIFTCGAAFLCAQEKKPSVPTQKKDAPAQSGIRVFRDPATGELRAPTAAERRAAEAPDPAFGPGSATRIVTNGDGSLTAILGPEYRSYSVVRKNPDGTVTMECVTGEKKAADYLKAAKTPVDFSNKPTSGVADEK